MSRTDKDVPVWVRAEHYQPHHRWRCRTQSFGGDPCNLPPEPKRQHPRTTTRRGCYWWPAEDWRTKPEWLRGGCLRDPQRPQFRDRCRLAGQHFRAGSDPDLIPIERARPAPGWDRW